MGEKVDVAVFENVILEWGKGSLIHQLNLGRRQNFNQKDVQADLKRSITN